jgi:predicted ferric reductase
MVLLAPLAVAGIARPRTGASFLWELGKSCALVAAAVLALQFLLAARVRGISRHFGLDMVLQFHRSLAVSAALLLVLHPALLAAGGGGWSLLLSLKMPWNIWLGKAAVLLLLIHAGTSLLRGRIGLDFERWRALHNLAIVILGLAFLHGWITGSDLRHRPMQVLWLGLFAGALVSYAHHKAYVPLVGKRRTYRVDGLDQETHNVWTLRLLPPEGGERFSFMPGQFHFLSLYRGDEHDGEEHPFTISSSPTARGQLTSTIKESGDFTRTIANTELGARVRVEGPFGRFSYVLHPNESDLVFIAGGIGITPLMGMLRHMRAVSAEVDVLLLYGNQTEDDIAFRHEIEDMARSAPPRLTVVHVLSSPGGEWRGETGYIDRGSIVRWCGEDVGGKAFYVCGPPPMMAAVTKELRRLGVPSARIHGERFAL